VVFLFTLTRDFTQLAITCVLLGVSQGVGGQVPLTMASDCTMNEPHGSSMGLFRMFTDIGFIVGPVLVGSLIDAAGMNVAFYSMSAVTLASLGFTLMFAHETLPGKDKRR